VADGILWLYQSIDGNSGVRKLQVAKMRGQAPLPGLHTMRITGDGLEVFPRILRRNSEPDRKRSGRGIAEALLAVACRVRGDGGTGGEAHDQEDRDQIAEAHCLDVRGVGMSRLYRVGRPEDKKDGSATGVALPDGGGEVVGRRP